MRAVFVTLFAGLLAACGVNNSADVFALSEEVQRAAILECKNERGVPGPFTTGVFAYGSSKREVLIEPSNAVTLEDARAINACARTKLTAMTASSAPTAQAADKALVDMCVEQTGAPGAYNWQQRGGTPVVRNLAKFGGTQEGEDMINACIRQNAVLFQDEAPQAVQPVPVAAEPVAVEATPPLATPGRPAGNPMCPAGVTGLYRGNMVC